MKTLVILFAALVPLTVLARTPLLEEATPKATVAVYAKVIVPGNAPEGEKQVAVEPWIAKKLKNGGAGAVRAVTGWVRIVEAGDQSTKVWTSELDGKLHGCPVSGRLEAQDGGKKLAVNLSGWTPVGAHVEGAVVPAVVGTRRVATVRVAEGDEKPHAWVALEVRPLAGK